VDIGSYCNNGRGKLGIDGLVWYQAKYRYSSIWARVWYRGIDDTKYSVLPITTTQSIWVVCHTLCSPCIHHAANYN